MAGNHISVTDHTGCIFKLKPSLLADVFLHLIKSLPKDFTGKSSVSISNSVAI